MSGLREDQQVRGELVAMIIALLPAPCRSEFARAKGTSSSAMRLQYLREQARSYKGDSGQAGG